MGLTKLQKAKELLKLGQSQDFCALYNVEDPYFITLELPGLPKTENAKSRFGGSIFPLVQEKKKWKSLVAYSLMLRKPLKPIEHAIVHCVRFSSNCPDHDGLVSSFKSVIDGLVAAKIIQDDKMKNIGMPQYHWVKAPPRHGKIRVLVEADLEKSQLQG